VRQRGEIAYEFACTVLSLVILFFSIGPNIIRDRPLLSASGTT